MIINSVLPRVTGVRCLPIAAILAASFPVFAQQNHFITAEQVLDLRLASDVHLSPDGKTIAFVITEPGNPNQPEKTSKTNIWLVPTNASGRESILEGSSGKDTSPRWSPDGRTLAFLSSREEAGVSSSHGSQIYLWPARGGKPERLTHVDEGAQQFKWAPDGKIIAFTVRDPVPGEDVKRTASDAIVMDLPQYSRLWAVNVGDHKISQVTKQDLQVYDFDWSPDTNELVLLVAPTPSEEATLNLALVVVRRSSGEIVRTLTRDVIIDAGPRWSPDGQLISFIAPTPRRVPAWLAVVPAAGGPVRMLLKDLSATILTAEWRPDSRDLLAESSEGTQEALLAVDTGTGTAQKLVDVLNGPEFNSSFSSNGGALAYLNQTSRSPNDVWVKDAHEKVQKLTDLNPQTRSWPLGNVRTVEWKNTKDGAPMNGVLITPPGFESGRPYPTVVAAHPGWVAWWAGWQATWWSWGQMLAGHGYVVFMPNYRGAWGQGWQLFDTIADWGGMALQDLNDGIDSLVQQKIADPNRLGIGGWSNGGFVAALAITQNPRFKAAVLEAPVTDFFSCQEMPSCAFLRTHLVANPYQQRAIYDEHSPITFIRNCHTPTLLLHGGADDEVPIGQSYEFYYGLKTLGIETKMVVYPRENHYITEREHQVDLQKRVLDWFDLHLKNN
jgi:dipeptidyl aminopeptidase/acylaminoacyl peptidase